MTDVALHSSNFLSSASIHSNECQFQENLIKLLPNPIDLKLNTNRSHFISVRFNKAMKPISASIHEFFLHAPQDIIETLALYIRNKGEGPILVNRLREYISNMFRYHRVGKDEQKKVRQASSSIGKVYDLKKFVEEINSQFFSDTIDVSITWFTSPKRTSPTTRCALGLYFDELNLIKINSKLDNILVPDYVLSLVVYHEMLHIIHEPVSFPSGKRIIHTKEFRIAERKHPRFYDAEEWLKTHKNRFFHVN